MSKFEETKETAKKIRARLRKSFPDLNKNHFYVKSDSGAVRVFWHDTPSKEEVDKIVQPYSGKTFDGVDDLLTITGYIDPETGEKVKGSSFVFTDMEITGQRIEMVAQEMLKDGIVYDPNQIESRNQLEKYNSRYDRYGKLKEAFAKEKVTKERIEKGYDKLGSNHMVTVLQQLNLKTELSNALLELLGHVEKEGEDFVLSNDLQLWFRGYLVDYNYFAYTHYGDVFLSDTDLMIQLSKTDVSFLSNNKHVEELIAEQDELLINSATEIYQNLLKEPNFKKPNKERKLIEQIAQELYQNSKYKHDFSEGYNETYKKYSDKFLVKVTKEEPNIFDFEKEAYILPTDADKVAKMLDPRAFIYKETAYRQDRMTYYKLCIKLLDFYFKDNVTKIDAQGIHFTPDKYALNNLIDKVLRNGKDLRSDEELLEIVEESISNFLQQPYEKLIDETEKQKQKIHQRLFFAWANKRKMGEEDTNSLYDKVLENNNQKMVWEDNPNIDDVIQTHDTENEYLAKLSKEFDKAVKALNTPKVSEFKFEDNPITVEVTKEALKEVQRIMYREDMKTRVLKVLAKPISEKEQVKHLFLKNSNKLKTVHGLPYLEYVLSDTYALIVYPHGITTVYLVDGAYNITHVTNLRVHTLIEAKQRAESCLNYAKKFGLTDEELNQIGQIVREYGLRK